MKKIRAFCIFFIAINSLVLTAAPSAERGQACVKTPQSCNFVDDPADLESLALYLHKITMEKNNGKDFDSGTFVIEDPGFKLFDKLRDYVKAKFGDQICREITFTLTSAYPRRSTHFNELYLYTGKASKGFLGSIKKNDCDFVHYGIDLPKDSLAIPGKHHFLFGRVGTINGRDLIFIKPEPSGLSGLSAISHGLDLLKTKAQRLLPDIYNKLKQKLGIINVTKESLEKEFTDLLSVTSFDTGGELTTNRRERIPAEFLAYFLILLLDASKDKTDQAFLDTKAQVKAYGVQAMISAAEKALSDPKIDDELKKKFSNFIELLKTRYPSDYFMRFGNEIIIK